MIQRILALLLLALGSAAWGASSCVVVISSVAFGTYIAASPTPLDAVGAINVVCDGPVGTFVITTDGGSSGNPDARTMVSGAERLSYQLYSNAARTNTWKSPHNHPINSTEPRTIPHTLYGRIFASQDVAPGAYSDSVAVTIVP